MVWGMGGQWGLFHRKALSGNNLNAFVSRVPHCGEYRAFGGNFSALSPAAGSGQQRFSGPCAEEMKCFHFLPAQSSGFESSRLDHDFKEGAEGPLRCFEQVVHLTDCRGG